MKYFLVGPSGSGRAPAQNARRAVNLYAEIDDAGGKEKINWFAMPGLKAFCDTAAAVRGEPVVLGDYAYFVAGTDLYRVDSAGTVSASLGTIPGTGNVSMSLNSFQVAVVNGTKGHIYIYDTAGSTFADVTAWSDASALTIQPDFITYMDGMFIVNNANSGDGHTTQMWFFSALDDGESWDKADFTYAQRFPDPMVRPYAHSGDLLLYGTYSLEPWFNMGIGDIPFEPSRAAASNWGLAAPWTLADLGEGVVWVGQRRNGGRAVLLMEAYTPKEISTHAVAYWLNQASAAEIAAATGYVRWDEGHCYYRLTIGDATWEYDIQESKKTGIQMWAEVTSYDGSTYGAHRGKFYVYAFGKHLVSDHTHAKILELDSATRTDLVNGTARQIQRIGTGSYLNNEDNAVIHRSFGLDYAAPGGSGTWLLEFSDDAGSTWTSLGTQAFTATDTHSEWFGLGLAEFHRMYRVTTTDAVDVYIIGAWVDAEDQGK